MLSTVSELYQMFREGGCTYILQSKTLPLLVLLCFTFELFGEAKQIFEKCFSL